MAIRDGLFDDAYDLFDANGFMVAADLTVRPWNRTTVADGQWLQDHAIGPLSARDLYLADCIQSANNNISNITQVLTDAGFVVKTGDDDTSTENKIKLANVGGIRTYSYQAFGGNDDSFDDKNIQVVPTTADGFVCTPFTLGYSTIIGKSNGKGNFKLNGKKYGCIIQGNLEENAAIQMGVGDGFLGIRYLTGSNVSDGINYKYLSDDKNFNVVPVFSSTDDIFNNTAKTYGIRYSDGKFYSEEITTYPVKNVSETWFKPINNSNDVVTFKTEGGLSKDDAKYFITKTGFEEYTTPTIPKYNFTSGLTTANNQGVIQVGINVPNGDSTYGFKNINGTVSLVAISIPETQTVYTPNGVTVSADNDYKLGIKYDSSSGLTAGDNGLALNIAAGSGLDFTDGAVYVKTSDLTSNGITTAANNKLTLNNNYVLTSISGNYAAEGYSDLIKDKSISGMITALVNTVIALSAELNKKADKSTDEEQPTETVTE